MDVYAFTGGIPGTGRAPIVRIVGKLCGLGKVIYRELELWARNPEGVWDWLGKRRGDLKTMGRHLTNREIYNYFKDCIIVRTNKLEEVVRDHCVSLEFVGDLKAPDGSIFMKSAQFPQEGR